MKKKEIHPPRLADRFLQWFCAAEVLETLQGDLYELYEKRRERKGKLLADIYYVFDVLSALRPFAFEKKRSNSNYTTMFQHYFKISWRSLLKNKGYSLINVSGLSVGMAAALLIGLWIYDELSFNKYHDNYESIARLHRTNYWENETSTDMVQAPGIGTMLKTDYGSYFKEVVMVRSRVEERVLAHGDRKFTQGGYFMQAGGPNMLTLKMVSGSRDGLREMNSILLSASLAAKLFGDADPLGKLLTMDASRSLEVTGVYEDLPKNSDFHQASYFAPFDLYLDGRSATLNTWDNYFTYIYVLLQPESNMAQVSAAIKEAMLPHVDDQTAASRPELFLHPMKDWHLNSEFESGVPVTSKRMRALWSNATIGVFVLLLACINFMNLSTARSEKRAKEVGILKAIGSHRSQLINQFFSEALLVTALSMVGALIFVSLSLPWFNSVADKGIALPLAEPVFWMGCLAFALLTGLMAGSYPALYLSSLKPVEVLKGTFKAGRLAALPRKVLVVLQFAVSIGLIIGTFIVHQQIQYAKNRPVGYSREGLLSIRSASPEYRGKYMVMRNDLKGTGVVEEMAEANYAVTDTRGRNGGFSWKGREYEQPFNTIFVTHEYGKAVGWEFVAGRDFSRDLSTDLSGIIINESAQKSLGIENPVGEMLTWTPGQERGTYKILGVVKDMVKGSPFEPTEPSIVFLSENDLAWMYIRIKPEVSTHEALPKIQEVFARHIPSLPFDYTFADEEYARKFAEEERIGKLAAVFAGLAILISCLGLFGLATFVAGQRTKEIGIRKVMGASVGQLWQMLSKDFVGLVVISCILAMPLAWYFMGRWLQGYEYRTEITWEVFAGTGLAALFIAICTVSYQAIRAATANPVKSLRSE